MLLLMMMWIFVDAVDAAVVEYLPIPASSFVSNRGVHKQNSKGSRFLLPQTTSKGNGRGPVAGMAGCHCCNHECLCPRQSRRILSLVIRAAAGDSSFPQEYLPPQWNCSHRNRYRYHHKSHRLPMMPSDRLHRLEGNSIPENLLKKQEISVVVAECILPSVWL